MISAGQNSQQIVSNSRGGLEVVLKKAPGNMNTFERRNIYVANGSALSWWLGCRETDYLGTFFTIPYQSLELMKLRKVTKKSSESLSTDSKHQARS